MEEKETQQTTLTGQAAYRADRDASQRHPEKIDRSQFPLTCSNQPGASPGDEHARRHLRFRFGVRKQRLAPVLQSGLLGEAQRLSFINPYAFVADHDQTRQE